MTCLFICWRVCVAVLLVLPAMIYLSERASEIWYNGIVYRQTDSQYNQLVQLHTEEEAI
jgi:TM2 domain-containing membrane protein YozV